MRLISRARPRIARYSVDQVLRGIQAFVSEHCGERVVVDPNASVYAYAPAARKSHECPLEFLWDLARYFQLSWQEERWVIWLKLRDKSAITKHQREEAWRRWECDVAPHLTVRRLAEFIAKRAQAISFDPIVVLGRKCAAAGVFEGLCGCPEVKAKRVGPSTHLLELGSSTRICELWSRSAWVTGVKLPTISKLRLWKPRTLVQHLRMLSLGLSSFATFIFAGTMMPVSVTSQPSLSSGEFGLKLLVSVGAGALVLFGGAAALERAHDPLPPNVKTFGDLARLIAQQLPSR